MHRTMFSRAALVLLGAFVIGACDDDETTAPSATSIEAVTATSTAGLAGQAAPISPTVVVTSGGAPAAGVVVRFAVQQGAGGSVQFANVTTDASGTASAGTWLLGAYPGTHTVTASVEGLAPVVFSASVGPGAPAQLAITAGNNQEADPGEAVATNPTVALRDAFNTPIANSTVTFTITGGGGTIAGGGSAQVTTNAQGVATVGPWVLGTTPGPNTLRASAGTVQVTFSATALGPCDTQRPLVGPGDDVDGSIVHGDPDNHCMVANIARDNYLIDVTAGEPVLITLTSSDFTPTIHLSTTAGTPIGMADGVGTATVRFFPSTSFTLLVGASASAAGEEGDYTLTVASASDEVTACEPKNVVQVGFSTSQELTDTDCLTDGTTAFYGAPYDGTGPYRSDVFWLYLTSGQSVTIRQAGPAGLLDALWVVFSPAGTRTFRDGSFLGPEQATYTASATGFHRIVFTSFGEATNVPDDWTFAPYEASISP